MNNCSNKFCLDYEWQASFVGFMLNLRDAILAIPENSMNIYQQVSKPLTRAAIYMICVIIIFVLLAVAGSAITVHEFLLNSRARKGKHQANYTDISGKNLKNKIEKKSESSSDWLNECKSYLKCFCVLNNVKVILSTSSDKNQFECMHGIRVINNIWIILVHFLGMYMSAIRNVEELKPLSEMWISQLLLNGQYAVDAFFVMSGFLNAYFFFKNYDKNNGNVSWFYFYLKRFIRLTPVYMVVLGFYTCLLPYMGSGPISPTFDINPVCSRNWFWSLLYINNFLDFKKQCMEWCWYLAADIQFYIISPIFLILLMRNPIFGYVLTGSCIFTSCLASFIITKQYNLVDGLSRMEYHFEDINNFYLQYWEYYNLIYTKPHTRIISYLIAILLAHYLYKKNIYTFKCNKRILFTGWSVSSILFYIIYFALFKREESIFENAIYNGIKHLFYSIGLSWIIFACLTGQGGIVNRFLSWKYFCPLAKLSYCAYIIHPLVLIRYYQTAKYFEVYNIFNLIALTVYTYFWTYVFSFISSLFFEFPFLNLLDLISKKQQTVKRHISSKML